MIGLEEYVKRHGRHFTKELALAALDSRWTPSEILKSSERLVYYNVSKATSGDIVYLANLFYKSLYPYCSSRVRCVRHALDIIGDVNAEGYAFDLWILKGREFDFTPYI